MRPARRPKNCTDDGSHVTLMRRVIGRGRTLGHQPFGFLMQCWSQILHTARPEVTKLCPGWHGRDWSPNKTKSRSERDSLACQRFFATSADALSARVKP